MFLSQEEALRRLNSPKNLLNKLNTLSGTSLLPDSLVAQDQPQSLAVSQQGGASDSVFPEGCKTAGPEMSFIDDLKDMRLTKEKASIIARSLLSQGVPEAVIAAEFNLSSREINSKLDDKTEDKIKQSTRRIRELALDKMMIALGLMTPDKFENAMLKDLNGSVTALAKVMHQTTPLDERLDEASVKFVVHTPAVRSLNKFEILDV